MKQKIKKLLLAVSPLLFDVAYFVMSFMKYAKHRLIVKSTSIDDVPREKLFICGNGPSLQDALDNHLDELKSNPCMVVNKFANTPYFKKVKPRFYMFADPNFFMEVKDMVNRCAKEEIPVTAAKLQNDVDWPLTVFAPYYGYKSNFIKQITSNPNITVYYYNTFGRIDNCYSEKLRFKLWDKSLLPPFLQTVLNTAVWLGIKLRFKEVYLLGADTSWHAAIQVNQDTNELYSVDTHFYNRVNCVIDNFCLWEAFDTYSRVFFAYHQLRRYADFVGVKVYNASAFSWIDSFERKKL
jgi:hypothetical protein